MQTSRDSASISVIFFYIYCMKIESTDKETIFRFSSNQNIDELIDIIDYIQFKKITTKSKASHADLDKLLMGVKKGRFNKLKARIGL